MRPFAVLALITATAQEPGSAATLELAVREGGVTIHARAVALKEILDRLANATGMKVVYDGAPPLSPVTISLENAPPPVAVLRLMEGLGLGYAFSHDPVRSGVATLLLFERREGAGPAPRVSETRAASKSEDSLTLEEEGEVPEPADVDPSQPHIPDGVSLPSRPLIPDAVSLPSQPQIPEAVSFPRR